MSILHKPMPLALIAGGAENCNPPQANTPTCRTPKIFAHHGRRGDQDGQAEQAARQTAAFIGYGEPWKSVPKAFGVKHTLSFHSLENFNHRTRQFAKRIDHVAAC